MGPMYAGYCIFPSWRVLLCKTAAKKTNKKTPLLLTTDRSAALLSLTRVTNSEWYHSGGWSKGSGGHSPELLMKLFQGLYIQTGDFFYGGSPSCCGDPNDGAMWTEAVDGSFSCLRSQIIKWDWCFLCPAPASQRSTWCNAAAPRKTSLALKTSGRTCESFQIRLCLLAAWNPLRNWATSAIL